MVRILFVCHGNICRSVMAQCVFSFLDGEGRVFVDSAGTSGEESGNAIYPPARHVLLSHGIPIVPHRARKVGNEEYSLWDRFLVMDRQNERNLTRLFGFDKERKISFLGDGEIPDPWYTDDFESAYRQIRNGCERLYKELRI